MSRVIWSLDLPLMQTASIDTSCTSQQAQLKSASAHRFATVLPQVSKSDLQRMQVRVLIGEFPSPFMTRVRCDPRGCSQCRSRRSAASTPPSYRYLRASTPARIWRRRPSSIRSVSSMACRTCYRPCCSRCVSPPNQDHVCIVPAHECVGQTDALVGCLKLRKRHY
jgi:hypothetical protein